MTARILSGEVGVEEAVAVLRRQEVVGLPTETVYGLAGDAFQPLAMARIFEAKGRPLTDPLIVHLPEAEWLNRVAQYDSLEQEKIVKKLSNSLWPGPLTIILSRHKDIGDLVTAGMGTVAVRVTAHPLFQEVLRRLDSPLAAPSANRFGRISPTKAEDVQIELGEMIPLILDGGACEHGMESTIISLRGGEIEIQRPGPITEDQLKEFGHVSSGAKNVNTPGSLPGHYAPKKELQILKTDINLLNPIPNSSLLAFTTPESEIAGRFSSIEVLSPNGDRDGNLREAAANFYGALRRLDQSESVMIYAESLPEHGIGVAIMDRMRRAEYGSKHHE